MPYSSKDLNEQSRFIQRIRFADAQGVNLLNFQDVLQEECDANGIPVAFHSDILKTGSLLNKQAEDILIIYNPEHPKDYFNFLVRITYQGKYAFLDVFTVGQSKNYSHARPGSNLATSMTKKLINAASGHKEKLQQEEDYYTILSDCIQRTIS